MSEDLYRKSVRNLVFIEARANGINEELVRQLAKTFEELDDKLAVTKNYESKRRIRRILNEFKSTLRKVYARWSDELSVETSNAIQAVIKRESKIIIKDYSVEYDDFYQVPVDGLNEILKSPVAGGVLKDWTETLTEKQIQGIQSSLFTSFSEGIGGRDAARRLRKEALGLTRNQADVVARTYMIQSATRARESMYKEFETVLPRFRYVAVLDSRTCPICSPDDGKMADKFEDLPSVPRHPRCRCQRLPWTRTMDRVKAERPSTIDAPKKVQHRDGSTSTKFTVVESKRIPIQTTYKQWFETLPDKDKIRILGKKRFALYKEKGLSLDKFRTPTGIRSIKELEKVLDDS